MKQLMQRATSSHPAAEIRGDHAVVLGASMAGLLAARVLAEHFHQVSVVERDRLHDEVRPRRGVPQGSHVHVLLPRGARVLEELFPGLLDELVAGGVPTADALDQIHFAVSGHLLANLDSAHGGGRADASRLYEPSRAYLEAAVLRRVRALPNVDIMDGYDVEALTTDPTLNVVTGARITRHSGEGRPRALAADLVVAALGRNGRAVAWLQALGYPPPPEEHLTVDLKYVTQRVRLPAGSVGPLRAVVVSATPDRPTGVGAVAQEDGTWTVTMVGYRGHHPPMAREKWLEFGDAFLPTGFAGALRAASPAGELQQHRFPANLRRRYEKVSRFPAGLLVTGDALSSFNPAYGQGMTVAALEALALDDVLRDGGDDLAPRFFRAAAKPIGNAWRFAVGADLAMPPDLVQGPRPLPVRVVNRYVDRFQAAAEADPVMAWRFLDVTGFDAPTAALFGPDSLRRMASHTRSARRTATTLAGSSAGKGVWP